VNATCRIEEEIEKCIENFHFYRKRKLRRPRLRWKINIKINLTELECKDVAN
jgi:hypothetical protein